MEAESFFQEPNVLNPYCFLIFKVRAFRKLARLDPDEMAFTKRYAEKVLKKAGFKNVVVEYRDFLVPGVPDFLIKPSIILGDAVERIPGLNALAQSLFIRAEKQ